MNKILITITVLISLIVGGCSSNSSNTQATKPPTSSTAPAPTPKVTTGDMTLEELKKFNGQNGNPAYAAVNGIIYDVSNANGWKNGVHKNGIKAGADLTKLMADSPHGTSVLKDLPVIGKLK